MALAVIILDVLQEWLPLAEWAALVASIGKRGLGRKAPAGRLRFSSQAGWAASVGKLSLEAGAGVVFPSPAAARNRPALGAR